MDNIGNSKIEKSCKNERFQKLENLKNGFIRIPKKLFNAVDSVNQTALSSKYESTMLGIYCYLYLNMSPVFNAVNTSLYDLVIALEREPKSGTGNTVMFVKNMLMRMKDCGIVSFDGILSGNKLFKIVLNKNYGIDDGWVKVYYDEYVKIVNSDLKELNTCNDKKIYHYEALAILCWMKYKNRMFTSGRVHTDDDVEKYYLYFSSSFKEISKETSIANDKVSAIFSILYNLNIICYRRSVSNDSSDISNKKVFFCPAYVRDNGDSKLYDKDKIYHFLDVARDTYFNKKNTPERYARWEVDYIKKSEMFETIDNK